MNLPAREVYPTENTWGLYGWTFEDLKTADEYFIKLIEKIQPTVRRKVNNGKLNTSQLDIFSIITKV